MTPPTTDTEPARQARIAYPGNSGMASVRRAAFEVGWQCAIAEVAAERASGGLDVDKLAEALTRLSDTHRSDWHDTVLPNGAGESWACVSIADVMEVLREHEAAATPQPGEPT